jgi:Cys-tRNA(Pro)/Cys-tRNA(Cys) deacylase
VTGTGGPAAQRRGRGDRSRTSRTRAIAAAERAGVAFRIHAYEHDPERGSYGLEAADKLGLDAVRVFKTLVVDTAGRLAIAMIPVTAQLDLKAVGKRTTMADDHAAERATGYVLGGISPLGLRRPLPTMLDASAIAHETIYVSAGRRGLEIELDPQDLVRLSGAEVRAIAKA